MTAAPALVAEFIDSFECPMCGGGGEIGVCPMRCDGSHVMDTSHPCQACNATGAVTFLDPRDEDEPVKETA